MNSPIGGGGGSNIMKSSGGGTDESVEDPGVDACTAPVRSYWIWSCVRTCLGVRTE